MSAMSSDMSLMDLLFDREDPMLKDAVKHESVLMDDDCRDDAIVTEEWPTNPDDFLDSIFKLDNQFDLIDSDLVAIPSSSSDSGLSSALSSCEQQLSPLLPIEEDQIEFSSELNSPQEFVDFDTLGSPNQFLESSPGSPDDSPVRSVMSSNLGSPGTDIPEEMDFEQTMQVNIVEPDISQETLIVEEEPEQQQQQQQQQQQLRQTLNLNVVAQHHPEIPAEATINLRNLQSNKRNNIRQLIRVTPVGSGNPRSILLPVSLKDMKEVRTIKIINAAQARNLKGFKINQGNVISKPLSVSIKQQQQQHQHQQQQQQQQDDSGSEKSGISSDEVSETEASPYPRLKLNSEEKRLLQKEGITLPSHYPLTKHEERELKRIRRKIRNKISAQDSRKRKKEYVDGLEDRVKQCTEENMTLLKRIKALQSQNQSLAGQLKRLQTLIQNSNKNAQPATCLMVLLLSLALVAVPNLRSHSNSGASNELTQEPEQSEKMPPLAGRSRSLLYTKQILGEDLQQCGEELLQEVEGLLDHDYSPVIAVPAHKRPRLDPDPMAKLSASYDYVGGTLGRGSDFAEVKPSRHFIEPPLDDVWPPPKPGGEIATKIVDKLEALTNELKINISDADGTRTVLLKVPHEQ